MAGHGQGRDPPTDRPGLRPAGNGQPGARQIFRFSKGLQKPLKTNWENMDHSSKNAKKESEPALATADHGGPADQKKGPCVVATRSLPQDL